MERTKPTDKELENRFVYHLPTPGKIPKHARVTELTLALAKELRDLVPNGRDLSLALTHLEDVRMRANAGIACNPEEDLMAVKKRPLEQRFREDVQKPLDALHKDFERLRGIAREGGHDEEQRRKILGWLLDQFEETHKALTGPRIQERLVMDVIPVAPVVEDDPPL